MMNVNSNNCVVYLACGYTDMRKSIDGLAAIVQLSFMLNPFDNTYFVFCGKTKNKIKILHWDSNGFCLYYKRYDFGKIDWPKQNNNVVNCISYQQLQVLLEGSIKVKSQNIKPIKPLILF